MTKLQQVRAKIIEANPKLDASSLGEEFAYTIRLADCILAAETRYEKGTDEEREAMEEAMGVEDLTIIEDIKLEIVNDWNLHKDSLDDQSEDTINFLHTILC